MHFGLPYCYVTIHNIMSNLHLVNNPDLKDFQQYVADMIVERGFEKDSVPQLFMRLLEECGELAKAAKHINSGNASDQFDVENEAADVFIYLLGICNHLNIDLEKAFREKEEINKKRTWN